MELIRKEIANKWAGKVKCLIGDGEYGAAINIYHQLRKDKLIPPLSIVFNPDYSVEFDSNKQHYLLFYFCIAFEHYYAKDLDELRNIIISE